MDIQNRHKRSLRLEPLEARLVLSCDFSGDGVCDVEDLDALYDASSLSVTAAVQLADQVSPTFAITHDYFITTKADIVSIRGSLSSPGWPADEVPFVVYNLPAGSDVAPPSPELLELYPEEFTSADSWIRTPGDDLSIGGTFNELESFGIVADSDNTGPAAGFHFARFTVTTEPDWHFADQFPFQFSGEVVTLADDGVTETRAFSVKVPNASFNGFNFDQNEAVDAGDIPGWLASASVANSNNLTYRMGDVNLDGYVDSTDLGEMLNNFGQSSSDLGWGDGDLNMSGTVDSSDLGLLLNGFGFDSLATHASVSRAAEAIDAFAGDLYEELQKESGNIVFSPLSIATAFGMTYAGARGQTATEMAEVLHFGEGDGIHSSFRDLLSSYEQATEPTEILVANSLWPDTVYPVRDEFIDGVVENYDAAVQNLDYSGDPAGSEDIVNDWVAEKTNGRIEDLLNDDVDDMTVMILANAMFFKSFWDLPFEVESTRDATFAAANGTNVSTRMMQQQILDGELSGMRIGNVDGTQVLEMFFRGGAASMVFMLPPEGDDTILSPETFHNVNDWADASSVGDNCIEVGLPKFETTVSTGLTDLLPAMGMPAAFIPGQPGDPNTADFTGAFFDRRPYITNVSHKAFIKVDESGAEAAAATAIVQGIICFAAGTPVLTADGMKPIEEIKVGDYVLSRDENDPEGAVVPKLVEGLFQGDKPVIQIQVGGQTICPTNEHPFFVKDRGWTEAVELQVGDLLSTPRGSWIPVEAVTVNPEVVPVYNFRVADFHTYFVGDEYNAVWAHNCCGFSSFIADRPFHFAIRDNINETTVIMGRIDDPTQLANSLAPDPDPEPDPSARASELVEVPTEDSSATEELIVPAVDLLRSPSGKAGLADRGKWTALSHDAMEPCVDKDLSVETLVAALDRIQGREHFGTASVDKAMEHDSLSLDWVDSLKDANELAAF